MPSRDGHRVLLPSHDVEEIRRIVQRHDTQPILTMTVADDRTVEVETGLMEGAYGEGHVYYLQRRGPKWIIVRQSAWMT